MLTGRRARIRFYICTFSLFVSATQHHSEWRFEEKKYLLFICAFNSDFFARSIIAAIGRWCVEWNSLHWCAAVLPESAARRRRETGAILCAIAPVQIDELTISILWLAVVVVVASPTAARNASKIFVFPRNVAVKCDTASIHDLWGGMFFFSLKGATGRKAGGKLLHLLLWMRERARVPQNDVLICKCGYSCCYNFFLIAQMRE